MRRFRNEVDKTLLLNGCSVNDWSYACARHHIHHIIVAQCLSHTPHNSRSVSNHGATDAAVMDASSATRSNPPLARDSGTLLKDTRNAGDDRYWLCTLPSARVRTTLVPNATRNAGSAVMTGQMPSEKSRNCRCWVVDPAESE